MVYYVWPLSRYLLFVVLLLQLIGKCNLHFLQTFQTSSYSSHGDLC